MRTDACITTSWDDGHPLDFRVAELLAKYRLPGTFYTPRQSERTTMTCAQIRELSRTFEIGAHTLGHIVLTTVDHESRRREIGASKEWLENITGTTCRMFCPPRGKYTRQHIRSVREAGFAGMRTVELGSLAWPRRISGLMVMPTSVQSHPHGLIALSRNAVRRAAFGRIWRYVRDGRDGDWPRLCRAMLKDVLTSGGVFHLWGHSWELDAIGQWQRLDDVLRLLSQFAGRMQSLTNGEVCQSRILFETLPASGPRHASQMVRH